MKNKQQPSTKLNSSQKWNKPTLLWCSKSRNKPKCESCLVYKNKLKSSSTKIAVQNVLNQILCFE